MSDPARVRSEPPGKPDLAGAPDWLFCPGNRPERFAKAAAAAGVTIIDLEDGCPADQRVTARQHLVLTVGLDPDRVVIRINAQGTPDHAADLAAVRRSPFRAIMLAKAETPDQLDSMSDLAVIALCETPLGIENAFAIAAADSCAGLMWGSEDLAASLGAASSRPTGTLSGTMLYARHRVLFAAASSGRTAVDTVFVDIEDEDEDGLRTETHAAVTAGFTAKAVIHPRHAAVVRAAFAPSEAETRAAELVVAAAARHGGGAFALDGRMIDEPVVRQSRRVLARAAAQRPADAAASDNGTSPSATRAGETG